MADYRLVLRRDTAANWTSANPVLNQGEPGFETDTDKLKIGDGVTAWSALPYFVAATGASIDDLADVDTTTTPPSSGDLLEWDGANFVPVTPSADTDYIEKQYKYDGALALNTGTARLYVPANCAGYDVSAYLGTASSSGDVTVDVLLDGSVDTTVTIPALSTTATTTSSVAITAGSYVTIDITGIGTGSSDLYLTLTFTRT